MIAIVLSFDRLALRMLGSYGNAWIDTPHFDRLAAEGGVFDAHFGEHFAPNAETHAWFTGRYRSRPSRDEQPSLGAILRQAEIPVRLIVEKGADDPAWESAGFDDVVRVSGREGLDVPDDETPFPQLIAAAAATLDDWDEREIETGLLWLKSRGVPHPWTPPREFAAEYVGLFEDDDEDEADEFEQGDVRDDESEETGERSGVSPPVSDATAEPTMPEDFSDADSPEETLDDIATARAEELEEEAEEFDQLLQALGRAGGGDAARLTPEDWKLARAVYAGYVSLLDTWFGELREVVSEMEEDVLWIITAAEGDRLGERVGLAAKDTPLSEERVHTPLIVKLPGDAHGTRRQDLAQTVDLAPTLCAFFDIEPEATAFEGENLLPCVARNEPLARDAAFLAGEGWRSIRTPDLYLQRRIEEKSPPEDEPHDQHGARLYVKPDDIWEIHDVAPQSPGDVEDLEARLNRFFAADD